MILASTSPRSDTRMVYTFQIKRDLQRGDQAFLVTVREEEEVKPIEDIPSIVTFVLEEFQEVMPQEWTRKLPPEKEVEHRIELVSGLDLRPWYHTEWPGRSWRSFK